METVTSGRGGTCVSDGSPGRPNGWTPRVLWSVRAKILMFAALALILTSVAFTLLALRQLDERAVAEARLVAARADALMERLLQQQFTRLHALGTLVGDLPGAREAVAAGDGATLAHLFETFWADLNLHQGVDHVAFHGADGRVLQTWGSAEGEPRGEVLARAALRAEAPTHALRCAGVCQVVAALPLMREGRDIGALVLAAGLQDLLIDFRRLSGAELAVIGLRHGDGSWPAILTVSGGADYEAIARAWLVQDARAPSGELRHDRRYFRLHALATPAGWDLPVRLLMIRDATTELRESAAAVRSSLLLGGLVLVTALTMLFMLLRPTMNRLRQAMSALPLLGEGRYAEARHAVQGGRRATRYADEVDGLGELTHALADTLERLQTEAREHAAKLQAQAAQLEHERDFVTGLLDTAPVLILTHGDDGRIRLANAQAVQVSGREANELIGARFESLFFDGNAAQLDSDWRERLGTGEIAHGEGACLRPDGERRELLWFHSRLDESDGVTLSVGLDVTVYRRAQQDLLLLTEHDGVTGLYNRRAYKRELDTLLGCGAQGVMLVCDIDEFKSVNESGGHEAGDHVLREFARIVEALEPAPALAARLGGDDFAMAYPGLTVADAIVLTRALNQAMVRLGVDESDAGLRGRLSASVGLVSFPEHGADADSLLANAEIALAQARAKGHGSWHLYSADDPYHEVVGRRAFWRAEIERALEQQRFTLHFQPIRHIASGEVRHYEALLRLRNVDGKLVPPGLFIDVAEGTGLIRRIDQWVIDHVVRFAAGLPAHIRVALNLSSRSFDDDVAFETMQAALSRHGLAGDRLLLEITETAALANFSSALRIMARFRGLGCAFGLDDFGVGYSSFQYLKELPVDFVKIDGSFIKGLTVNADDVVFVRALNEAVKGYGKATVAEFVEDEATLDILRSIGVDYAQGYLIGRPGEMNPDGASAARG